jgi:hypothetical protein
MSSDDLISKVRAVLEASGESCAATSPRPHIEACPEDAARVAAMRLINYRQDQVLATYTLTSPFSFNSAAEKTCKSGKLHPNFCKAGSGLLDARGAALV